MCKENSQEENSLAKRHPPYTHTIEFHLEIFQACIYSHYLKARTRKKNIPSSVFLIGNWNFIYIIDKVMIWDEFFKKKDR